MNNTRAAANDQPTMRSRLEGFLVRCDDVLTRTSWAPYLLLVIWYVLVHFPDQVLVRAYGAIANPLESLVLAKLLFAQGAVRPDLASTLAEPANGALIYPPGIYILTAVLGSVRNTFLFLFAIQIAIPLLLYRLLKTAAPPTLALLIAVIGTYYFIKTSWWAPDFVIQPLMILAVMMIGVGGIFSADKARNIVIAGLLTSLIIVLKHNVGIFFGIACGTWFFFCSFSSEIAATRKIAGSGTWISYLLILGFVLFAPVFVQRLLHWDEVAYYLLPYVMFWLMFALYVGKQRLSFNLVGFARKSILFAVPALLLPAVVFIAFGGIFGYAKYLYSLGGMGFKYLPIWDKGIYHVIAITASSIGTDPAGIYQSTIFAFLYLLPLIAGVVVMAGLARAALSKATETERVISLFRNASIGIMTTFTLYPLEGIQIAQTKAFLFIFVVLYCLRSIRPSILPALTVLVAVATVPVIGYALTKPVGVLGSQASYGDLDMQRVIDMPVRQPIANEMEKQLSVLRRTVAGRSYYIIESSGGTLVGLSAMIESTKPQYYIELRDGILDQDVVDAVIKDLSQRSYAVVNEADYGRYASGAAMDPYMKQIVTYVDGHFSMVDRYDAPTSFAPTDSILGFKVFKRRH